MGRVYSLTTRGAQQRQELRAVRFQLQVYMADNDAGERLTTSVRLRLRQTGRLALRATGPRLPQPTYEWTLADESVLGIPKVHERDAAKIFAIALSTQTWRFFHSPVILTSVSTLECVPRGGVGVVSLHLESPRVIINEHSVIEAAIALTKAWRSRRRTARAAINAYWDALHAVQTRARFLSLYAALELAVNLDGARRFGRNFDQEAARISGEQRRRITALRQLNIALKHADAVRRFRGSERPVGSHAASLKKAVDAAFGVRFHFRLSEHHRD